MKASHLTPLLGVIAVVLGSGAATPPASTTEKSPWITDLAAAKTTAKQTGKPIFLVFR